MRFGPPLRIGLAASALHRAAPNSALFPLAHRAHDVHQRPRNADARVASCKRRQQQSQRIA
jgi:hypothetical protein